MAANEVKNLTGRALPHWHVKLFIVFRSTFKEKFLTWVDWARPRGLTPALRRRFPLAPAARPPPRKRIFARCNLRAPDLYFAGIAFGIHKQSFANLNGKSVSFSARKKSADAAPATVIE
ncbi:hypothetical protein ACFDR9_004116 [Janthinobacterium sp. CG_23.3]